MLRIFDINIGLWEHPSKSNEGEAIVGSYSDYQSHNIRNYINLSRIAEQRLQIPDKYDNVDNICYVVSSDRQS